MFLLRTKILIKNKYFYDEFSLTYYMTSFLTYNYIIWCFSWLINRIDYDFLVDLSIIL